MEFALKNRTKGIVLAGTIAVGVLAAAPAYAEGSWSSHWTNAGWHQDTRSWQDSQLDNVDTTLALSGCSLNGPAFKAVYLTLYDEHGLLPDSPTAAEKKNTCGTSNWGHSLNSDGFHITIDGINGVDANPSGITFSATSVVAHY